jgi:hypothetical protein
VNDDTLDTAGHGYVPSEIEAGAMRRRLGRRFLEDTIFARAKNQHGRGQRVFSLAEESARRAAFF